QAYVRDKMPEWKTRYDGVETMTLAVMGCVVNGPGESKAANIGISLPGTGEAPNCPIFIDGRHVMTLRGSYEELAAEFQRLVDEYGRPSDFLHLAGCVGDDPVSAQELNRLVAFIGDAHRIVEEPLVLERLRPLGRVLRFDFDPHVVRDGL